MNLLGNILIVVACLSSGLSAMLYVRSAGRDTRWVKPARVWLGISAAATIAVSVLLLSMLLQHDFTNSYVYSYSSRALPLHFLVSSFYAGQEGSFLFWSLCSALIGVVLASYARRRNSEQWVMAVFMGIQCFLLLLVYAKTPFRSIWVMAPQIQAGQVPPDGRGLNPLLQNIWMVIHPPILFVGFAAMAVPFSFTIGGLWRKEYGMAASQGMGWLLFAVLVLGVGIMLGGYWAYGVLGWGGYWAWDPVENSSLIPWLIGVALVHTLIVQRRTGRFMRSSAALGIAGFLSVIYSTFLTRSGVLGDSSVHAFVDPGATVYWLLVAFLVGMVGLSLGFMAARRKEMRPGQTNNQFISREAALAVGALVLVLSAAVVIFGTSLPLTGSTTVEPSFYNATNLPLVAVMVLAIGLSLYTQWGTDRWNEVARRAGKWLIVSTLLSAGLFAMDVRDQDVLLLSFGAVFAILVNLEFAWKQKSGGITAIGGKIAHVGLGVFLVGVIASGRYNSTRQTSLVLGQPAQVLGYTLTYTGYDPTPDNKYAFHVEVEKDGSTFVLSPLMFDGGQQGTMRNPDMASFLTRDFYVSPMSLQNVGPAGDGETYTIEKGKSVSVGAFTTTFVEFDMNSHDQNTMAGGGQGGMAVGSILEVSDGKTKERLTPSVAYAPGGETTHKTSESRLLGATVRLVSMKVGGMGTDPSTVTISVRHPDELQRTSEALVVEVSVKPFIVLVWTGSLVMFAGFLLAMFKRLPEI